MYVIRLRIKELERKMIPYEMAIPHLWLDSDKDKSTDISVHSYNTMNRYKNKVRMIKGKIEKQKENLRVLKKLLQATP